MTQKLEAAAAITCQVHWKDAYKDCTTPATLKARFQSTVFLVCSDCAKLAPHWKFRPIAPKAAR